MGYEKAITVIVAAAFLAMVGTSVYVLVQEQDKTSVIVQAENGLCITLAHEDGTSECIRDGQKIIIDPAKDQSVRFIVKSDFDSGIIGALSLKGNDAADRQEPFCYTETASEHAVDVAIDKGTFNGSIWFKKLPLVTGERHSMLVTFHVQEGLAVNGGAYADGGVYSFSADTTLTIATVDPDANVLIKWDALFTDPVSGFSSGGQGEQLGNSCEMWISWIAYFNDVSGDAHITFETE